VRRRARPRGSLVFLKSRFRWYSRSRSSATFRASHRKSRRRNGSARRRRLRCRRRRSRRRRRGWRCLRPWCLLRGCRLRRREWLRGGRFALDRRGAGGRGTRCGTDRWGERRRRGNTGRGRRRRLHVRLRRLVADPQHRGHGAETDEESGNACKRKQHGTVPDHAEEGARPTGILGGWRRVLADHFFCSHLCGRQGLG
jgi:hypothetical protein